MKRKNTLCGTAKTIKSADLQCLLWDATGLLQPKTAWVKMLKFRITLKEHFTNNYSDHYPVQLTLNK